MNTLISKNILDIIPTLYYDKNIDTLEKIIFRSRELLKNLNNIEKIILYQTDLSYTDSLQIIELILIMHGIWDKDYDFNKKEIQQKKELFEIYLKDSLPSEHMSIIFNVINNIFNNKKLNPKYNIIRDIVLDTIYLEMLSFETIDRIILNNKNTDIHKLIIKRCKEDFFNLKEKLTTSYAKEAGSVLEKQLKLIVLDTDFLDNHINTRKAFLGIK